MTSDYYILNLACSDIILPLCGFPLAISSSYKHLWIFGEIGKLLSYLVNCLLVRPKWTTDFGASKSIKVTGGLGCCPFSDGGSDVVDSSFNVTPIVYWGFSIWSLFCYA